MIDARTAPHAAPALFGILGLPGALACPGIPLETLGGLALIAGVRTSIVAAALVPVLPGAVVTVHRQAGFFFGNEGGGRECPAFWTVGLIVAALPGDGGHTLRLTRTTR